MTTLKERQIQFTQDTLKKMETFAHLGKADLHIHLGKNGTASVENLLKYVQDKTDLDVIAITEHDTIETALRVKQAAEGLNYRFEIIVGEEITSKDGHILGLFLKEQVPPGLSAGETLKRIKEQGGITVAPHPFQSVRWQHPTEAVMDGIGPKVLIKEKQNIDAIEVINASPGMGKINIKANLINKTILFKAETGSSDAHIPEVISKAYTVFEGKTAEDLRRAILSGQTQAISGRWTKWVFLKYIFFFIPLAVRIGFFTFIHGKKKERV
jgi:predicted metal-dependent phosphoesterase TrpH